MIKLKALIDNRKDGVELYSLPNPIQHLGETAGLHPSWVIDDVILNYDQINDAVKLPGDSPRLDREEQILA